MSITPSMTASTSKVGLANPPPLMSSPLVAASPPLGDIPTEEELIDDSDEKYSLSVLTYVLYV